MKKLNFLSIFSFLTLLLLLPACSKDNQSIDLVGTKWVATSGLPSSETFTLDFITNNVVVVDYVANGFTINEPWAYNLSYPEIEIECEEGDFCKGTIEEEVMVFEDLNDGRPVIFQKE